MDTQKLIKPVVYHGKKILYTGVVSALAGGAGALIGGDPATDACIGGSVTLGMLYGKSPVKAGAIAAIANGISVSLATGDVGLCGTAAIVAAPLAAFLKASENRFRKFIENQGEK